MYKWVFSKGLKLSGDEHRQIASGRVFQVRALQIDIYLLTYLFTYLL